MIDFGSIYPRKGIVMPLKDIGNKELHCLKCGKSSSEISAYGWTYCGDCEDYTRLFTTPINNTFDSKLLYNNHKDHDKPCCGAKAMLETLWQRRDAMLQELELI